MLLRAALAIPVLGLLIAPAIAGESYCGARCYRKAWVPPVYETHAETYLAQAPRTYAYVTPAAYRVVHERAMVHPGSRRWTVKRDHHGHEIGCWVETPARYATVARKVMVHGPQVVPVATTAQYGVRTETVMTHPGHKAWVPVGHGHALGH